MFKREERAATVAGPPTTPSSFMPTFQPLSSANRAASRQACVCPKEAPCQSCRQPVSLLDELGGGEEDGSLAQRSLAALGERLARLCPPPPPPPPGEAEAGAGDAAGAADAAGAGDEGMDPGPALALLEGTPAAVREDLLRHLGAKRLLTDAMLPALVGKAPEELDLRWNLGLLGPGVERVAERCSRVRLANLAGCKKLQGDAVEKLCTSAVNLTQLVLDGCAWHLTGEHVRTIASACEHLRYVNLARCMKVTDEGIGAFKNLEVLLLTDCTAVTDAGLARFATASPACHTLDLNGCISLSDAGLTAIANACPCLRSLGIGRTKHVTDDGLSAITNKCRLLKDLTVNWCAKVTDRSLRELAIDVPTIRFLNLLGCISITDAGVIELAKHCTQLEELNLAWCQAVTGDALRRIRSDMASLDLLIYFRTAGHFAGVTL